MKPYPEGDPWEGWRAAIVVTVFWVGTIGVIRILTWLGL